MPSVHGPREVTLRRTAPNVFRVVGDYGQGVAGLATYAYRRLGWRRAAIVLGNWDAGWQSRDAFASEFCALGGTIGDEIAPDPFFDPAGRDVRLVPRDVDGVAVFVPQWFGPTEFIKRLARRVADPAREIVVGPAVVDEPEMLQATAPALAGVAGSSYVDPPRMRHHVRAYARAFPGASGAIARSEAVTSNSEAVEALLRAFERAHGDTDRLPAELARLRIDLLGGPVRLDKRRQAVVSTTLVRIEPQTGGGGAPRLTPLQRMHGVDQSIDGLLPPSLSPGARPLPCRPRAR